MPGGGGGRRPAGRTAGQPPQPSRPGRTAATVRLHDALPSGRQRNGQGLGGSAENGVAEGNCGARGGGRNFAVDSSGKWSKKTDPNSPTHCFTTRKHPCDTPSPSYYVDVYDCPFRSGSTYLRSGGFFIKRKRFMSRKWTALEKGNALVNHNQSGNRTYVSQSGC